MDGSEISMERVVRRIGTHTMSNGKEIVLCALSLKDFVAARDKCLSEFKRRQLLTWTENVDLLPEDERQGYLREAFARVEQLTVDQLPKQTVVDEGIPMTLDYASWWMSDTAEGKLFTTWLSMRKAQGQEKLTLDDIDNIFMDAQQDLDNASKTVGDLSAAKLGNSEAPETTRERRKTKRRRR